MGTRQPFLTNSFGRVFWSRSLVINTVRRTTPLNSQIVGNAELTLMAAKIDTDKLALLSPTSVQTVLLSPF
jgi:hypothetical protein